MLISMLNFSGVRICALVARVVKKIYVTVTVVTTFNVHSCRGEVEILYMCIRPSLQDGVP